MPPKANLKRKSGTSASAPDRDGQPMSDIEGDEAPATKGRKAVVGPVATVKDEYELYNYIKLDSHVCP